MCIVYVGSFVASYTRESQGLWTRESLLCTCSFLPSEALTRSVCAPHGVSPSFCQEDSTLSSSSDTSGYRRRGTRRATTRAVPADWRLSSHRPRSYRPLIAVFSRRSRDVEIRVSGAISNRSLVDTILYNLVGRQLYSWEFILKNPSRVWMNALFIIIFKTDFIILVALYRQKHSRKQLDKNNIRFFIFMWRAILSLWCFFLHLLINTWCIIKQLHQLYFQHFASFTKDCDVSLSDNAQANLCKYVAWRYYCTFVYFRAHRPNLACADFIISPELKSQGQCRINCPWEKCAKVSLFPLSTDPSLVVTISNVIFDPRYFAE